MEFVHIDEESIPRVIYTPYIYATINEYSTYYTVQKGRKL